MTPTAEPTSAGAGAFAAPVPVPARLIQDGEQIVLAIKPSPWYILLVSLPVLLAATAVFAGVYVFRPYLPGLSLRTAFSLCALAWVVRLFVALLEWLSRIYVLTNLRVLRIKGVLRVDVFECPLGRIQNTVLSLTLLERLWGLGSIYFATAGTGAMEAAWLMIARPQEVHEIVVSWIRRAPRNHQP